MNISQSKIAPDQYVLGVNRVLIDGNGPGQEPEPLGMLLDRLERNTLSPMFAEYGFVSMAHFSRDIRDYDDDGGYILREEDLGPMYADAPYAVSFFGNFHDISAGFRITTDDPEVVEVLLSAIEANMRTPAYTRAAREWANSRWNRSRA